MRLQLPVGLPEEPPFEACWRPVLGVVWATAPEAANAVSSPPLDLTSIQDALRSLDAAKPVSLLDLAARLDPADPLAQEVAAAEAAHAAAGGAPDALRCRAT